MRKNTTVLVLLSWLLSGLTAFARAPAQAMRPVATVKAAVPAFSTQQTAEELIREAKLALVNHQWEKAAIAYQALTNDFGDRPEVAAILARLRPAQAMCLVQLQRFKDAIPLLDASIHAVPAHSVAVLQQLTFQRAICELNLKRFPECLSAIAECIAQFPSIMMVAPTEAPTAAFLASEAGQTLQIAHILNARCLIESDAFEKAAYQIALVRPHLDDVHASEATLLEVDAHLKAGQPDRALAVLRSESHRLMAVPVTLNLLTLKIGDALLARGQFRDAIHCFSRVRTFLTVQRQQEERIKALERQISWSELEANSPKEKNSPWINARDRARQELNAFRQTQDFDASVRLRLATAYQAMGRYRETALILEDTMVNLQPAPMLEQTGVTLAQCWSQCEEWARVEKASDLFQSQFPNSDTKSAILLLRGIAQQRDARHVEALATFEQVANDFAKTDFAVRAQFMAGFGQLLSGQTGDALLRFDKFLNHNPQHPLAESALYWKTVALSINKQHSRCIEAAKDYAARYPNGENRVGVILQKAHSTLALHNDAEAVALLRRLLATEPRCEQAPEAQLLLGDALRSSGDEENALAAYQRISSSAGKAFEEGWFKGAKLLQQLGREAELLKQVAVFETERPQSARLGEAILWVAKTSRQVDTQRDLEHLIWEIITHHGNDPAVPAVEDLLAALPKHCADDAKREELEHRLRELREEAERLHKPVMALRAVWALASAQQKTAPEAARNRLLGAAAKASAKDTSSRILADMASAREEIGQTMGAMTLWRDLLKWHPRAIEKDRALAGLITAAVETNHQETALALIARFEGEVPTSGLTGRILLAKSDLQRSSGDTSAAQQSLEGLLSERLVLGQFKAEALLRLADIQMQRGKPELAVPYYQRVYVMYGRWKGPVAKAYLRSAEAFEALGNTEAARRTYEHMLVAGLPGDLPELTQAGQRLQKLEGIE